MLTQQEVYNELKENMPSIGFCSRNKRINACFTVLHRAQQIIDAELADSDIVTQAVVALYVSYKPFYKAVNMTVFTAPQFTAGMVPVGIGETFVQHICNINRLPGFYWNNKGNV